MGLGSVLLQNFSEFGLGVIDFEFPVIDQEGRSVDEFLLRNATVTVDFDCLEVLPEFVVKTKIDEGPLELSSRNVVFSMSPLCLDLVLAGLVSPHDDWLGFKEFRQFEHISDALVDFCEREVLVAINIKFSEEFFPLGDVVRRVADGDLRTFLFDAISHPFNKS